MNARKPQNSIIALATLGVYLGLLLAGATPGVLAQHAALTKEFNIKDEIGRKDDLDKKPDDERSPVATSVQVYLEDIEYFFASLGRLKNKGEFNAAKDTFFFEQNVSLPCVASNVAGSYTPIRFDAANKALRRSMEYLSNGMIYGYSLGDCLPSSAFQGVSATDSRFTFQLDKTAFSINIAVKKDSPQRALALLRELKSALELFSTKDHIARTKVINNTKLRAENDQLLIVTRLPRGSLIRLLSSDAK